MMSADESSRVYPISLFHDWLSLLLYIFFEDIRRWGWTRWILASWVFWAALNGLSRLYLEQHYPPAVLTGYALGAAWFGLTLRFLPDLIVWCIPIRAPLGEFWVPVERQPVRAYQQSTAALACHHHPSPE